MSVIFQYNQEMATQIGGGSYVTKSGGYDFKIVRAQFAQNQNSQARALEFDFETRDGLKCNYVSINFQKGDGTPNDYGHKLIQAIIGCAGVNQLSEQQGGNCPELYNKFIKGVVQRIDYTKNNGQDGYKFDFKMPANMQTGKTVKETVGNEPASAFDKYAASIEDKDERVHQMQSQSQQGNQGNYTPQYDVPPEEFDDFPF